MLFIINNIWEFSNTVQIFKSYICTFSFRYAGLHCVAISGYAKGVDYFPGDQFQGLPANHSWNAVFIKGSWQLVDAHWATRYLSSGVNMQDNVVYEYDDFYFLMEPQQVMFCLMYIFLSFMWNFGGGN